MANPTNKLTIIKDGKQYLCQSYGTELDATPIGGTVLKAFQHGANVECYFGLLPTTSTSKFHSPLKVTKNNKEYYIQTEVQRAITVQLNPATNQSYMVEYTDIDGNKKTESSGTVAKKIEALYDSQYKITLLPATGYTAGSLSIPATGTFTKDLQISVTDATKGKYVATVTVPKGATITLGSTTYKEGQNTVSCNYGDTFKVTYASVNASQYAISNTLVDGASFTSGNTYTMPAKNITITCTATVRMYTITYITNNGVEAVVKQGTTTVATNSSVTYGTTISVAGKLPSNTAQYSYSALAIKVNNIAHTSGNSITVTGNVSITMDCTKTINKYTITIPTVTNQTVTVTVDGKAYTSSALVEYGKQWSATIKGASNYAAGTVSPTSGTVTGNVTLNVTSARPYEQCFSFSYSIGNGYNLTYSNGYVNYGLGTNSYINHPPLAMNGLVTEINYISVNEVTFKLNIPQGITKIACIVPHRDSGDENEDGTYLELNGTKVWTATERHYPLTLGYLFPYHASGEILYDCFAKIIQVTPNTTYTAHFRKGTTKFKDYRRYPTVFYIGEKIENPEMCTITFPKFDESYKIYWWSPWGGVVPADETSWNNNARTYQAAKGTIYEVDYGTHHYATITNVVNGNATISHSPYVGDDGVEGD